MSSPLPFSILPTPFAAPCRLGRPNDIISSCPKQASRAEHYRPSGICPVVPASAQLPDTTTLSSRTISPFFADRASFQRAQTPALAPIQTLVTKKPIVTVVHICSAQRPHLADYIQTPYWSPSGITHSTDFEARPRAHLENETSTTRASSFAQARPFHRFHCPARSPPPCSDPRTFAHSLVSLAAYFGRVCMSPPRKAEKTTGNLSTHIDDDDDAYSDYSRSSRPSSNYARLHAFFLDKVLP